MHARGLDAADRFDGARQLAFEPALVVDLLGELAGAELLVVHQFEAHAAGLGQALRRELQARFRHLVARDQDRAAALGELVGHVHLLQRRDDRAAVAVRHVGVEHLVVGAAAPQEESGRHRRQRRGAEDQRQPGLRAHALQHRGQAVGARRQAARGRGRAHRRAFAGAVAPCRAGAGVREGIRCWDVMPVAGDVVRGLWFRERLSAGDGEFDRSNSRGFCPQLRV
ncbi:hypothetical protein D3C72_1622460 [compost metagenome]